MRSRLFLASLTVLLALAGPAAARGTLDSILPDIRSAHPGRLSDAEPWTDSEGRTHYRIKWLTPEGRILFFNADADSGRYSSSGGDYGDRDSGGHRARGEDESSSSEDNGGGHRSHWNGDAGDGDWRAHRGGDWNGGWRERHGDGGGQGNWDRGGRGGSWRGGQGGGGHHHHNGN